MILDTYADADETVLTLRRRFLWQDSGPGRNLGAAERTISYAVNSLQLSMEYVTYG